MSSNSDGFVIARVYPGDINAMVKAVMKTMGIDNPNEAVWRIKVGQWVAVPVTNPATTKSVIVRRVLVNRDSTPREMLGTLDRKLHIDNDILHTMSHGKEIETEVHFFKVGQDMSDDDLEKEYALRGLVAADPYAVAAVNSDDTTFAENYANGTHWKDSRGRWCYFACGRWIGERRLYVYLADSVWSDRWWFAGVRK